jgi:predicted amino acid racemase
MFLDALQRRNPALIDAAVELHAAGEIPPGTFVIDLDAVEENARRLAAGASNAGIQLYFMTKQVGRNPVFAQRVARHIRSAVAVDLDDATALAEAGVPIGHIGHLVQPHESALESVLALEPEVVTVFSVEKAASLAAAAARAGRIQPVLLRVVGDGDEFFAGQEGGIPLSGVVAARDAIDALEGVRAAGVTTYPAIEFADGDFRPTPNLRTIAEAAELLGGVEQLNAPGHTSLAVLPLLRAAGATHGEPGHALTGTTPLAAVADTEERPAVCYLSEVSHRDREHVAVFGSGFYARGHAREGLIVRGAERRRLPLEPLNSDAIDYYRRLRADGAGADVGDPVVFAFRFQAFTSRARVATVEGVAAAVPRLVGLHDSNGRALPVRGAAPLERL